MCGIIGSYCQVSGVCSSVLFNGLRYMQNRGYDSAGICSIGLDHQVRVHKHASQDNTTALDLLSKDMAAHEDSHFGFGHTRWATHGAKTDINSHPHRCSDDKFTLVHNGIIDNYKSLKAMLVTKGYHFASETDTEIICNLLSYLYTVSSAPSSSPKDRVRSVIAEAQSMMSGSWGLVIHCTEVPDALFCVRHGSPLLIGRTTNEVIIASEQAGFGNRASTYFILNAGDVCIIDTCPNTKEVRVTTDSNYTLNLAMRQMVRDSPAPFDHWTIREIHEQEVAAQNAISMGGRVISRSEVRLGGLDAHILDIRAASNIVLLGCGTSYHSGVIAMRYFKDLCDMNCVMLFDGAEFNEKDIPRQGTTVAIFISQSGETKDLHRCISLVQDHNILTIGVVNVVDSLIAREVDCGVYLNAGPEVAVASTKSFTSQTVVLALIAIWIAQQKGTAVPRRTKYIEDAHNLSRDVAVALANSMEAVDEAMLNVFAARTSCFLLGKGHGEGAAREGALKIKEITYIHAEGYSSSALKHGPFALLDEGFPVILFCPNDEHFAKNQNALQEVISRGASVIVVHDGTANQCDGDPFEGAIAQVRVPRNQTFQAILNMIPVQVLAYKLSVAKGINPDTPKNLAKVVTVD